MMRVVHNRLGDPNTGGGYGIIKPKSAGVDYTTQSIYPYHEKSNSVLVDDEDDEMFDDIMRKTDMSSLAKPATTGRTDRGTFTKMRLDMMESVEDDRAMDGITPFPFSSLYKKFSGPAVGGFVPWKIYTTSPGKSFMATSRGWSQAPDYNPVGDKLTMHNIGDMIDPGIRSLAKANLMIKLSKEDSE